MTTMTQYSHAYILSLIDVFSRLAKADWRKTTVWGIKTSEVRVLVLMKRMLDQGDTTGTTVSELRKTLQVTSPTVTQMTNSLIHNGYIERSPDQSDRRISKLTLTEAGVTLAQKAMDQYKEIFAGLIDHLGKEQTDQLIHLLSESFTYLQGVGKKNAE